MRNRLASFLIALCISLPCAALAADLKVGDPAPPIKVSQWVTGTPLNTLESKDKGIVVIEFWATWCGPCIQTIPHVSKVAKHFEKQGVKVVGISVDGEDTRDKVAPFVKKMGKKMDYAVAMDDGDATFDAYATAAGVEKIPHAFIVGKDGKIAWHGHPMGGLDIQLADMVGDKAYAETAKKIAALREKLGPALEKEDWDKAISTAEKLFELEPEESGLLVLKYQLLVTRKKDAAAAAKLGEEIVKKIESPDVLDTLAWGVLVNDEYEGVRDLPLALKAAKKANDLSEGKDWSILDTYARAAFDTGDPKQAAALQKKAVEIAAAERIDEGFLSQMKDALHKYEASGDPPASKEESPEKKD